MTDENKEIKGDIYSLLDGYKCFIEIKENTKFIISKNSILQFVSLDFCEKFQKSIKELGYCNFDLFNLIDDRETQENLREEIEKIDTENEAIAFTFPVIATEDKNFFYALIIYPLKFEDGSLRVQPFEKNPGLKELCQKNPSLHKKNLNFSNDNPNIMMDIFELSLNIAGCILPLPFPLNFVVTLITSRGNIKKIKNYFFDSSKDNNIEEIFDLSKETGFIFRYEDKNFWINLKKDIKEIQSRGISPDDYKKFSILWDTSKEQSLIKHHEDVLFKKRWFYFNHDLTESQRLNYARICDESNILTLIEGPPGTGKTNLIAIYCIDRITEALLSQMSSKYSSDQTILITSTNNKAVDNVIEKLQEFDEFLIRTYGLLYGKYLKGYARFGSQQHIKEIEKELKEFVDVLYEPEITKERKRMLTLEIKRLKGMVDDFRKVCLKANEINQQIYDKKTIILDKESAFKTYSEQIKQMQHNLFANKEQSALFCEETLLTLKTLLNPLGRSYAQIPIISTFFKNRFLRFVQDKGIKISGFQDAQYLLCREIYSRNHHIINELGNMLQYKSALTSIENEISRLKSEVNTNIKELINIRNELNLKNREYFQNLQLLILRLKEWHYWNLQTDREFINNIKRNLDNGFNPRKSKRELLRFSPVMVSTVLSVRKHLPCERDIVGTAIVDEGGQTLFCYTIPIFYRSKKLVVIGDEYQLQPVSPEIKEEKLEEIFKTLPSHLYYNNSAIRVLSEIDKTEPLFRRLREHFRCQPPIIDFCNKMIDYGLVIKTKKEGYCFKKSLPINFKIMLSKPMHFIDIKGADKRVFKKSRQNQEEAKWIADFVHSLKDYVNLSDIAILTPYRAQSDLIRQMLFSQGIKEITVGTVHKLQGDEKDFVILSTVCSSAHDFKNSTLFNKRNINVAVSRAKKYLIVVGNSSAIEDIDDNKHPLYQLVGYIKEHNTLDMGNHYYEL